MKPQSQQTKALQAQLEARAKELGADIRAAEATRTGADEQGPDDTVLDSGDQGEQRTREIVLSAEEARDADELADIDAALQRLADGSYGACVDCEASIPLARLKVQPAAARCIECQERFEKAMAQRAPAHPLV